jgi:hypothetical protein
MWGARQIARTTLIVLFCAFAGSSTDSVRIHVFITTVKQDAPVQITGFKLPSGSVGHYAEYPDVLLHNVTAKEVKLVYFRDIVGIPRGVDGDGPKPFTPYGPDFGLEWYGQDHVIAPNGDSVAGTTFLAPRGLAFYSAQIMHSNCLHLALFVRKVEFMDGTEWKDNVQEDEALWRDSISSESASACDNSLEVEATLKHVKGATYSGVPPTQSSSDPVQFYSVACHVETRQGNLVAVCDW